MRSRLTALGLVSLLVVAACGSDDDSASDATAAPAATSADTEPPDTEPPATEPPATEAPTTDAAPTTEAPVETEPLADFELIGPGPYDVGVQTITVTDPTRDRPLTTDVWFPIPEGSSDTPYAYSFPPALSYTSPNAFVATAEQIAQDGPFPLVVFSHGSPGIRFMYGNHTEALASHGYVVVAADHAGNTVFDLLADTLDDRAVTAVNRPLDVSWLITAFTDPTNPETAGFVAAVDPERIAVDGQSAGGYTAYATVSGVTTEAGEAPADDRVDALITLAPASGGITDEAFASIDVPALVVGATNDTTTPIDPNVTRPWELSGSEPHYRVDLDGATHQSFTDFCQYLEAAPTMDPPAPQAIVDLINEYGADVACAPEAMVSTRAHGLTNTFAVTFLDSVFRNGEMIDPDTTAIPDDVVFLAK